jgi:hypothetical protein
MEIKYTQEVTLSGELIIMDKIPTAEEFCMGWEKEMWESIKSGRYGTSNYTDPLAGYFIEFTKLHVQAALKAAAENAETWGPTHDGDGRHINGIDKESIINAYPLTNIK